MEIKVGNKIAGVKILWIGYADSPSNQRRRYVRFACACREQAQTTYSIAAKAKAGKVSLRCQACQKAGEYVSTKKPAKEPPKAEPATPATRASGKVTDATLKALSKLSPEARIIANKVIRRHVQACRGLDVKVENLDRVVLEAIEEARRDTRHGAPTVTASLPKPEPFRRYEQYTTPKDA